MIHQNPYQTPSLIVDDESEGSGVGPQDENNARSLRYWLLGVVLTAIGVACFVLPQTWEIFSDRGDLVSIVNAAGYGLIVCGIVSLLAADCFGSSVASEKSP